MESYQKPARQERFATVVKKSRFITTVSPVFNKTEAAATLVRIRQEFPDANHHCWAVVAGSPDDVYQQDQSDDGEPKGTAGKPMLNVLKHSQLGNCLVVVTRYFGGIKLGAGGLVRAYTQATSESLKSITTETIVRKNTLYVSVAYDQLGKLEYWLQTHAVDITAKNFDSEVKLELACPEAIMPALKLKLASIGAHCA